MAHLPDAPLPDALEAFAGAGAAAGVSAGVAAGVSAGAPASASAGAAAAGAAKAALACEIHEHAVPSFVAAALDRLYGSLYASWAYLQLGEADQPLPHAWVAYLHGEVVGALLFRVEPAGVRVLNEMMAIDANLLDAFCRSIFGRYGRIHRIVLNAVDVMDWPSRWPSQAYAFSENYVIDLPASVEAYRALLGKSTKKTLNGYGNRIARELPGLRWECIEAAGLASDAQRSLVRTLQRFKRDGMQARGKQAAIDRRDTARLLLTARGCGRYGIATFQGRVVAGSLACRIGDSYVMLLSAVDPAFGHWRLGFLVCYWAICDCIAREARHCHLLWGRYEYKQQLLGQLRLIQKAHLYRSRLSMLLHLPVVLRFGWQMRWHRGRQGLLNYSREVTKRWRKFLQWNESSIKEEKFSQKL